MPSAQDIAIFMEGLRQFGQGIGGQQGIAPTIQQARQQEQMRAQLAPFLQAFQQATGSTVEHGAGGATNVVGPPPGALENLPLAAQIAGLVGAQNPQAAQQLILQSLLGGQQPFTAPTETQAYQSGQAKLAESATRQEAQQAQAARAYEAAAAQQAQRQATYQQGASKLQEYRKKILELQTADPNLSRTDATKTAFDMVFPQGTYAAPVVRESLRNALVGGNPMAIGGLINQAITFERSPAAIPTSILNAPSGGDQTPADTGEADIETLFGR